MQRGSWSLTHFPSLQMFDFLYPLGPPKPPQMPAFNAASFASQLKVRPSLPACMRILCPPVGWRAETACCGLSALSVSAPCGMPSHFVPRLGMAAASLRPRGVHVERVVRREGSEWQLSALGEHMRRLEGCDCSWCSRRGRAVMRGGNRAYQGARAPS